MIARMRLGPNRMAATSSGVHQCIRQSGMRVRRPLFCSFVDVLLSASVLSVCSSSAGTMVAPLLWFTASHRSSLSRGAVLRCYPN